MKDIEKMDETELEEAPRSLVWGFAKDYLPYLMIGVVLALVFRMIITPSVVVGESMEGSLHDGDYLLVYKYAYSEKKIPEYGDVVVLDAEAVPGNATFIKRVVGKPGDMIEINNGDLLVNGERVNEPYVAEKMLSEDMAVTVPEGKIFLLGDNRNNSMDSRIFGNVGIEEEVIGKVIVRLNPFNQEYKAN